VTAARVSAEVSGLVSSAFALDAIHLDTKSEEGRDFRLNTEVRARLMIAVRIVMALIHHLKSVTNSGGHGKSKIKYTNLIVKMDRLLDPH
jgi:hypothetical protein